MKKLCELIDCNYDIPINGIKINSREVEKGDLFICTDKGTLDRHNFIDDAIARGASAVVVKRDVGEKPVPIIKVDNPNDILLNSYKYLQQDFGDAKFNTDKNYDFESLKERITKDISNKDVSHRVVFVFDNTSKLTKTHYKELFGLLKDNEIYVLSINKEVLSFENDNVSVIDFYNTMKHNLMPDNVHLNDIGNQKLSEILVDKLLGKKIQTDTTAETN